MKTKETEPGRKMPTDKEGFLHANSEKTPQRELACAVKSCYTVIITPR